MQANLNPIRQCPFLGLALSLAIGISAASRLTGAEKETAEVRAQREALSRFQKYIGDWRGVGQPKRGSAKDAWSEECQWAWSFAKDTVTLSLTSPNGKYFRSGILSNVAPDKYEFVGKTAEGKELKFAGSLDEHEKLVFINSEASAADPSRITMSVIAAGDRLLMLYERRADGDRFSRLAEVGLTRKGSGFGQGTNYVECVVTGGLGTIAVTFEGKTYYVCCTGCRDHFNDHPAEVLAEYRERKAEEKKKKESP